MSTIFSSITLDEQTFSCAAIWLGDHNVTCGARLDMQKKVFQSMRNKLVGCFEKGQINEIIVGLIRDILGENNLFAQRLFKDDQRYVLDYIVADGLKKAKELYDIVYHDNSAMLRFMKENRIPSPKPLMSAAEIVLNMEIDQLLFAETPDLEKLEKIIADSKHLSVTLDSVMIAYKASQRVSDEFTKILKNPEDIETIYWLNRLIQIANTIPVKLNLWQAQNIAFKIAENRYKQIKQKTDETSKAWIAAFTELCELIGIRLA